MPKFNNVSLIAKRWFDKRGAGNTYHSIVVLVDGRPVGCSGVRYGYGRHYQQTALDLLVELGYLSESSNGLWRTLTDMGVDLYENVADVSRKGDLEGEDSVDRVPA